MAARKSGSVEWSDETLKKATASALIVLLVLFLSNSLLTYLNGFFGALILYVLFNPIFHRLVKRGYGRRTSAVFLVVVSFVVLTIPLGATAYLILSEVDTAEQILVAGADMLLNNFNDVEGLVPGLNLEKLAAEQITNVGNLVKDLSLSIVGGVAKTLLNLTILYFLFFYALVDERDLTSRAYNLVPFNEENKKRLAEELSRVTYSTIVCTGLIALLQGTLLAVLFHIFNVPGAFFWGFLTVIFSILPVVGAPVIWAPAGITYILFGNYTTAFAILAGGIIISSVDNILRPIIQGKLGRLHPLITLFGVIIGVPQFGILGLIIGPLLLSYLFLTLRMFKEEYLMAKKAKTD